MLEQIHEPISVELIFDSVKGKSFPYRLNWRGSVYTIKTIGLHHSYRTGRTLFHTFSVSDGSLYFRLTFNTENLHWLLDEVADTTVN
jgi:hypothetical protein